MKSVWQWTLLWPVIIDKSIMQHYYYYYYYYYYWGNNGYTRCVAMPSLMAARWVGQYSGPIFRYLWTILHQIKCACAGVFWLTISCCVLEILPLSHEIAEILMFWGRQISGGKGPPNFWASDAIFLFFLLLKIATFWAINAKVFKTQLEYFCAQLLHSSTLVDRPASS